MKTLEQIINKNPLDITTELTYTDVIFLKQRLFITVEQILNKYGKHEVNELGQPIYSDKQIRDRMPEPTKQMLWAVNNAKEVIQSQLDYIRDLHAKEKALKAEISRYQIDILKLQNKTK